MKKLFEDPSKIEKIVIFCSLLSACFLGLSAYFEKRMAGDILFVIGLLFVIPLIVAVFFTKE